MISCQEKKADYVKVKMQYNLKAPLLKKYSTNGYMVLDRIHKLFQNGVYNNDISQ